ncbi:MAG: hypothetical protein J5929_01765 [Eubacterium sp.]|nr:hypothetical protein [Eubacterium sp.]MBP3806955.1 hypothetical protein [Eubacterium sp.]
MKIEEVIQSDKALIVLNKVIILLVLVVTITGILSFNPGRSYYAMNQYGESIRIWGSGIYSHDSFFKAPIHIGTDITVLFVVVPLTLYSFTKFRKEQSVERYIQNFGYISLLLYYSACLAFGVTYNRLHLVYILLFSTCLFSVNILLAFFYKTENEENRGVNSFFTKGMKVFLILSGFSIFVAWLPDIIPTLIKDSPLALIEVYTTEPTYVLDMGIISPLMFITYYLCKKEKFIGYVLFRMILIVCLVIGIMLPVQTIFQILAGIELPIPALITKVFIFIILAAFALYFDRKLRKIRR